MQKIIMSGNKVLTRVSEAVDSMNKETDWIIKKLLEAYVQVGRVQGLAAPQIGISKRIVVCRLSGVPIVMINPVIKQKIGYRKSHEGCESVLGRYLVDRPVIGQAVYTDIDGKRISKWYTYKKIRVISHEVDHLNGVCINDIGKVCGLK